MIHDLNDNNFYLYAAKHYDRPTIIQAEFDDDLHRIKYVKRLLKKYRQTGEFKERLILNHIIILSNCFGVEPTVNMLFFRVDQDDYPILKTILLYLNYMPENFTVTFHKYKVRQQEIPVELSIADTLRKL